MPRWPIPSRRSLARDPRFSREVAEQTGYVPQTILAVPVETSQRMLGVLSLLDRDAGRPGAEQDMALLSLFAGQAALALASMERFSAMGRVLLGALADAAGGSDLVAAFAALARRGAAERRLALGLVRDIGEYAERRAPRIR